MRAALAALRERRPSGDQGSFTFAVLIWLFIFFAFMSLVINGGMEISAKEQAADAADSIARDIANDVDVNALQTTGKVRIAQFPAGSGHCDPSYQDKIVAALDRSDLTVSSCTVKGNSVTVTVTIAYTPLVWGSQAFASAAATATAVTKPTT